MDNYNLFNSDQFRSNDTEYYVYNLMHFFLDKYGYAILNIEEKILENFNHDYYNIIYIYTNPLINDVNVNDLLEKIDLIKHRLKRQFFLFHQRILILAVNCTMDVSQIDIPKNVDIINVSDKTRLSDNSILKEIYPEINDYPLELDPAILSYRLNYLSMNYIRKINQDFNKKDKYVSISLGVIIVILNLYQYSLNVFKNLPDIYPYLFLTRDNLNHYRFYTLITNNLISINYLSVLFSVFFLTTLGLRLEKVYGSFRYIVIILSSMIFTNALIFAFSKSNNYFTGFIPILYTFLGSFIFVIINYRRFLAMLLRRIIIFNLFLLFILAFFSDSTNIIAILGALVAGFVSSFVVGLPNHKTGNKIHRVFAGVFYLVLIVLGIFIGLK